MNRVLKALQAVRNPISSFCGDLAARLALSLKKLGERSKMAQAIAAQFSHNVLGCPPVRLAPFDHMRNVDADSDDG
jgi:hypothetical protein